MTSATRPGLIAGWFLVIVGLVPLALGFSRWNPRLAKLTVVALLCGVFACGAGLWIARPGQSATGTRILEETKNGSLRRNRAALFQLIPEVDQLLAIFSLMPAVDPILTTTGADRLKRLTREVYGEMDEDSEFRNLGSTLGETAADIFGLARTEAAYVYVPRGIEEARSVPIIVFFHGSGGNLKAYLWILARVAEQTGSILIAPGGGMGAWSNGEAQAGLDLALSIAARHARVDRGRVTVIGLSNGGRAVSQILAGDSALIGSFVFISPVFDRESLASVHRSNAAHAVLVISGSADDRVPIAYVEEAVAGLQAKGIGAKLERIDHEDHFVIFSRRASLQARLTDWIRSMPRRSGVRSQGTSELP